MKFEEAKEIVYGLKPDYDMRAEPESEKIKAGPNRWNEVKDDPTAYGHNFDYRVLDGDVWMPCCVASQEWIRSKVSEDQHWIQDLDGWLGVRVTHLDTILRAAERDGLVNEETYAMAMEERDRSAGE